MSQFVTKRSHTLDKVGVNEIGCRSFVMPSTVAVFRMGIMSACFHLVGIQAFCTDSLRTKATGAARTGACNFNIQFGKSSRSEDLECCKLVNSCKLHPR